jgi:CRISPR-associated protein Cmr4
MNRDLELAGHAPVEPIPSFEPDQREQAACPTGSPLLLQEGGQKKLVLEEFEFTCVQDAEGVAKSLAERAVADAFTRQQLGKHLVVLQDDDFTHFVRHATEVVARVGLDYERKTVKKGALFYQEFLPPETIFYAVVLASASRYESHPIKADKVLGYLDQQIRAARILQIGGDQTTGKGLCAVKLCTRGKEEH